MSMATWRNGYAEDCKSFHPSSILGVASKKNKLFSNFKNVCFQYSSVAQLVEQLTVNQLVAGSSPARGASKPDQTVHNIQFIIRTIISFCVQYYLNLMNLNTIFVFSVCSDQESKIVSSARPPDSRSLAKEVPMQSQKQKVQMNPTTLFFKYGTQYLPFSVSQRLLLDQITYWNSSNSYFEKK